MASDGPTSTAYNLITSVTILDVNKDIFLAREGATGTSRISAVIQGDSRSVQRYVPQQASMALLCMGDARVIGMMRRCKVQA